MDLVCLIDSEEKLKASDLVTMVGDLLERGPSFIVFQTQDRTLDLKFLRKCRDEIPREAAAARTNTDRKAVVGPVPGSASGHRLRYRIREQAGIRKYPPASLLFACRPNEGPHSCIIS